MKRERFHLVDSEAGAVWSPRCKKALIMVTFALGRRGAHSHSYKYKTPPGRVYKKPSDPF